MHFLVSFWLTWAPGGITESADKTTRDHAMVRRHLHPLKLHHHLHTDLADLPQKEQKKSPRRKKWKKPNTSEQNRWLWVLQGPIERGELRQGKCWIWIMFIKTLIFIVTLLWCEWDNHWKSTFNLTFMCYLIELCDSLIWVWSLGILCLFPFNYYGIMKIGPEQNWRLLGGIWYNSGRKYGIYARSSNIQ